MIKRRWEKYFLQFRRRKEVYRHFTHTQKCNNVTPFMNGKGEMNGAAKKRACFQMQGDQVMEAGK